MNLTCHDIDILLDLLSERILVDPELKEILEKKLAELNNIPPLYDDWIEKKVLK